MVQKSTERISFASIKNPCEYPDFLDIQLESFKSFFQIGTNPGNRKDEGLYKVFSENFPITDARNNFKLEFLDYFIDAPRYSIEECIERGLTYSVPLKAKLRLSCTVDDHEDFETTVTDNYLGLIPYMTPRGTFIINGAERVVVSQLHRSPGVFFGQGQHANGTLLYSARIIPFKGAWMEFSTDINNVMYAYIDRKKKLPITTLLRAIGYETDKDILDLFDLADEVKVNKAGLKRVVGRKLAARVLHTYFEDFVNEDTGECVSLERNEIVVDRDVEIQEEHIQQIIDSGAKTILLHREVDAEGDEKVSDYSVIFNTLSKDTCNSEKDAVEYIYRQLRNAEAPDEETARSIIDKLFFSDKRYDLGLVGRYRINRKLNLDINPEVRVLTKEDIIAIIKYLVELISGKVDVDDIDHLSNRRIRTVGEQLYAQFGVGLARMARTIRERMNVRDNEVFTPADLINAKSLSSVINSFFGTNQLSQFMDQTNPLSEVTHKRRISALGPGGLSRERAGFEVRDVHYTHYGRLCTIETPEGPNIGLISSLCVFAKVNELGFIETPYREVENGTVDFSKPPVYLTAELEENKIIAQAITPMDDNGHFTQNEIKARYIADYPIVSPEEINLIDVAPNQIASIAASLIPFLEHDDANRALMGSNMMRQAVPLMNPESPIVGTGIEHAVARDSRVLVTAEGDGEVVFVDSTKIVVRYNRTDEERLISFDGDEVTYNLTKYVRTNQSTSINIKPIVRKGEHVVKGQIMTEGYGTQGGDLALGRNLMVAFMPWKGYNYEDAIVISEKIVREDLFTSIHVEEFTLEVRDTKRGMEELTNDIPNVSADATKDLDEHGIIRVGAEVIEGDILIGKITPPGRGRGASLLQVSPDRNLRLRDDPRGQLLVKTGARPVLYNLNAPGTALKENIHLFRVKGNARIAHGAENPAPVGIVAVHGGLYQGRADHRLCQDLCLFPGRSPLHLHLQQSGAALPVPADLPGKGRCHHGQSLAKRIVVLSLFRDHGVSRQSVGQKDHRIIGGGVPVHRNHVEGAFHVGGERRAQHLGRSGAVRGDEYEHRRQIGMDHAGALGDAAHAALHAADLKGDGDGFHDGVGGHDGLGGLLAGVAQGRRQGRDARGDGLDGELLADDAGGGHDHVRRRDAQRIAREGAHRLRDLDAVGVAGVGVAAVADHRLGIAVGDVVPRHGEGRALHQVGGIYRRGGCPLLAPDQGQVPLGAAFPHAAVDAGGLKALRGADAAGCQFDCI